MPTRRNGWSECTSYVTYEPGRVDRGWMEERQERRFTFDAKALAGEIARQHGRDLQKGIDEDLNEFYSSLLRADEGDDRVTRLPERETGFRILMGNLVMRGEARVHCRLCRTMVDPPTLQEQKRRRRLPYQFDEIRCGAGHLLLRPYLIRLFLLRTHGIKRKKTVSIQVALNRPKVKLRHPGKGIQGQG